MRRDQARPTMPAPMKPTRLSLVIALAVLAANVPLAHGVEAPQPGVETVDEEEEVVVGQRTLVDNSYSYGLIVHIIIGLGVAALALVVTLAVILRHEQLLPRELVGELEALLSNGEHEQADDFCAAKSGCLCRIVRSGLATREAPRDFMLRAVALAGQREDALLKQRVRWLLVVAIVTPLLGIVGTLACLIRVLNVIAAMGGMAIQADLADGVSNALVSFVPSLLVALPALCAYVFFRNRAVMLSLEVRSVANDLLSRVRADE